MKSPVSNQKRPNIVWIISDDTSHAELGCYGGRILSPNIDSIAANGVRFENFHCVSIACAPSRYNYLTGHYGGRCPADSFRGEIPEGESYSLHFNTNIDPDRETTIARVFQDDGYFTGFTGKWHTGSGAADVSFAKKLPKSADPRDPAVGAALREQQQRFSEIIRRCGFDYAEHIIWGNHETLPTAVCHHNVEYTAKGALNFLDQAAQRDQPFFLHLATNTMHAPDHATSLMADPRLTAEGFTDEHMGCMPPRTTIYERITNAGLDFNHITAGVLWMDDCVGAVLDRVRAMGVENDTIIFFSTDHAPVGGKFTLYQPGVRIPLVMQWKNRIPKKKTINVLAQTVDLAPTLCGFAGVNPPESMALDGMNLAPVIEGSSENIERDELYFEYGYQRGLRRGKWKYIAWRLPERLLDKMKRSEVAFYDMLGKPVDPDNIKPTVIVPSVPRHPHFFEPDQLYDLESDPDEKINLAEAPGHAAALADIRARLQEILDTFDDPFNVTDPVDAFYYSDQFKKSVATVRRTYDRLHDEWIKGKGRISGMVPYVDPDLP
ncbi:MAG: sulfatase [Kiritimatiellia bacterium]